jgi:hypothetical protein
VTETIAADSGRAAPKGFVARIVGVLTSPRATYADVAARPRWLGVMGFVLLISMAGAFTLFSTAVGQRALLDQQVRSMESFGVKMTDAMYQRMQEGIGRAPYFAAVSQLVTLPLVSAILAGIFLGIFNAVMGGNAAFKQVFAVVVHSGVVIAVQQFFVLPLDYFRESLSSPTNLAVFVPMLDENTFVVRALGAIDLFLIWWMVNLSIGLAVLYSRRTGPIATTMIAIYITLALVIAGVKTALAGA